VPDGSDFRKPTPTATAAPDPSQAPPTAAPPKAAAAQATVATVTEETESLGGWAIDEPAPAPAAAPAIQPLVEQIQAAIAAGTATGPMASEQKVAIFERLMTPVGTGPFRTVVVRAIGEDAFNKPSAREAEGLIKVAESFVDEAELVSVWRSAAAAIAPVQS
jgi:pyruvate/2-oxoglutarate dehydrogenase complex dihydrolipoamide acyltransferase (E2) component